jgi:hypothetical protein
MMPAEVEGLVPEVASEVQGLWQVEIPSVSAPPTNAANYRSSTSPPTTDSDSRSRASSSSVITEFTREPTSISQTDSLPSIKVKDSDDERARSTSSSLSPPPELSTEEDTAMAEEMGTGFETSYQRYNVPLNIPYRPGFGATNESQATQGEQEGHVLSQPAMSSILGTPSTFGIPGVFGPARPTSKYGTDFQKIIRNAKQD